MKVIKRDGRAVEYDKRKIEIAINKANKEVVDEEKVTQKEIDGIIDYIETLGKKRMLVEDIQDIIEQQLMKLKKYILAKKYIVYRYTRALVRKQNTTDETILGIIRNEKDYLEENNELVLASTKRNYIAGEVSIDLTKRLLLPEKITNAMEEGIISFHNADYFIQPIINSSFINIKNILENDIIINNYVISKPENFSEVCNVIVQVMLDVANNQYGMQTLDISCLGEYVNKENDDIESSINVLKQFLNTVRTVNGKLAKVKFLININSNENRLIKDAIEKLRLANGKNIFFEEIDKPLSEDKLLEFDQGKVSINLKPIATKNKENFEQELENCLELCKDALMYKHYALIGTTAKTSPILWQNGGIARLDNSAVIDNLLNNGKSTLTLCYTGLNEAMDILNIKNEDTILKIINKNIKKWTEETGIAFIVKK